MRFDETDIGPPLTLEARVADAPLAQQSIAPAAPRTAPLRMRARAALDSVRRRKRMRARAYDIDHPVRLDVVIAARRSVADHPAAAQVPQRLRRQHEQVAGREIRPHAARQRRLGAVPAQVREHAERQQNAERDRQDPADGQVGEGGRRSTALHARPRRRLQAATCSSPPAESP
jgi:hypothetical protein